MFSSRSPKLLLSSWITVLALTLALAAAAPAAAAKRALLIAVTNYSADKGFPPLKGPKNDVRLLRDALIGKKFEDITVLADGVEGASAEPTYAEIIAGLDRLVAASGEDDFVVLYFTGHGSQQPQLPKANPDPQDDVELDGLDEIFLPLDIGIHDKRTGAVPRAITDDTIRVYLDRLNAKGAFVWAIFDACHSGDMTRGADSGSERRVVRPKALGITNEEIALARDRAKAAIAALPADERDRLSESEWLPAREKAGLVVFAASASDRLAREQPFVEAPIAGTGGNAAKTHGVFTYNLVSAFASGRYATFRALAQGVMQKFDSAEAQLPSPVFEGELDRSTRPIAGDRRWVVEVHGASAATLEAGSLHGIREGSILALYAGGSAQTPFAHLEIKTAGLVRSRGEPVAYAGSPRADLSGHGKTVTATLVKSSIPFFLRVALPGAAAIEKSAMGTTGWEAVASLMAGSAKGRRLPVDWVDPGTPGADLHLTIKNDLVYILPASGAIVEKGRRRSPAVAIRGDAKQTARDLRQNIWKILRQKNLTKLPAELPPDRLKDFKVAAYLLKFEPGAGAAEARTRDCPTVPKDRLVAIPPEAKAHRVRLSDKLEVSHCDLLYFEIWNEGKRPVDVTLLYLDSQYGIQAYAPGRRHRVLFSEVTSRIFPLQIVTWCGKKCPPGRRGQQTVGIERLMIVAVERAADEPEMNFTYLQQDRIEKATRAKRRGQKEPQTALQALLREAGLFPTGRRGGADQASLDNAAIEMFRWNVFAPDEAASR